MALHAAYLAFQHPLKGTDVVIESQVPFKKLKFDAIRN